MRFFAVNLEYPVIHAKITSYVGKIRFRELNDHEVVIVSHIATISSYGK